jgi:uncharacterized membrane protein
MAMIGIFIFVLLVLVLVVWVVLGQRIRELTARVYELEQELRRGATPIESIAIPEREEVPVRQKIEPVREPVPAPEPVYRDMSPAPAPSIPIPSRSERLRNFLGNEEWETLFAGSVLNKLGALVLVVGIALFLGYSFARMSPAGRASISALISVALLGAGIVIERHPGYRVFSRGLIGAGWAALYTTAYAMYALPAAQVISNAFAGSLLLLAVATGMIAHSLRYRAQAVTAVAYFSAFAALAVTPSTRFAVASLIPLAASLLYLAWRFRWHAMALFGLVATYGTCISRGSSNAPLWAIESLFIVYWLLFEGFDILRARRDSSGGVTTWIFPLNAIGFLGLSYSAWLTHAPHAMWRMAAIAALLYLISALARLPRSLEAPLTIAAVLTGLAIVGRVPGLWSNVGLAAEAELLYLAGVRFRSGFLRGLAGFGFAASLENLRVESYGSGRSRVLGIELHNWTPSLLFDAFLFYLNRRLWRPNLSFSFAASAFVALILSVESKPHSAGVWLFVFALILLELGLRKQLREFRVQAYLVGLTAVGMTLAGGGFAPHAGPQIWFVCAFVALACWFIAGRVLLARRGEISDVEGFRVLDVSALAGSAFGMLTLWMLLPGSPTALAWTALAILQIQLGFRWDIPTFRWIGNVVLGAAYVRLWGVDLDQIAHVDGVLIGLMILAALYYCAILFRQFPDGYADRILAPVHTSLAALLALRLVDLEFGRVWVVCGWAGLVLAFLVIGLQKRWMDFRWQSYFIAGVVALRCAGVNFGDSDPADRAARIFASSVSIAVLLAAQALTRNVPRSERHARTFFSLVATLLLTGLLFHEVSGSLLTLACGLEGLALLGVGILGRERILRLEGLGLLLLCILKLFIYDLRNLEMVYRILTFIALGVILLGVSWIYTRFHDQVRRYL